MANLVTQKQYQKMKNATVTLVQFRDGLRIMTTRGLSYVDAIEQMTMHRRYPGMASDTYMIVDNKYRATSSIVDKLENATKREYQDWVGTRLQKKIKGK